VAEAQRAQGPRPGRAHRRRSRRAAAHAPLDARRPARAPGAPPVPRARGAAPRGEPSRQTDLFDVELNTLGGDIRRVTLPRCISALDRTKPLTLLEPDRKHYFVTQSGLLGEGCRRTRRLRRASAQLYAAPGKDTLEVASRRATRAAPSREALPLPARQLPDRRGLRRRPTRRQADRPVAYFQFLRDGNPPSEEAAQTSAFAGVTTFTARGLHRGAKFHKVDFKDIAKGKQRTRRRRRTAGSR
jgi:YidC/Oxa1 family membrane protein insertase